MGNRFPSAAADRHVNWFVDTSWIVLLLPLTMPVVWNAQLARLQIVRETR